MIFHLSISHPLDSISTLFSSSTLAADTRTLMIAKSTRIPRLSTRQHLSHSLFHSHRIHGTMIRRKVSNGLLRATKSNGSLRSTAAAQAHVISIPATQQQTAGLASATLLSSQRNWGNETVVTLKTELKKRRLSQTGNKLVDPRLI